VRAKPFPPLGVGSLLYHRRRVSRNAAKESRVRTSRLLAIVVTVLLMTTLVSAGAFAQEVVPGDGNEFGEHVSGMAPEHPKNHGQEFGECVSTMAQTGDCPHHH
jgi:hypothetical protein